MLSPRCKCLLGSPFKEPFLRTFLKAGSRTWRTCCLSHDPLGVHTNLVASQEGTCLKEAPSWSGLVRPNFSLFILVDISDMFYFSARGSGKGVRGAGRGRGDDFLLKIPGGGGVPGGWGRGGEGLGGCLRVIGGGAKYFFSGPKFPPSYFLVRKRIVVRKVP